MFSGNSAGCHPRHNSISAITSLDVPPPSANATILDAKELNKVVRFVKDKPQRLLYVTLSGMFFQWNCLMGHCERVLSFMGREV